ncbi:unknown protein [Seminavis robusta]|uniref:Uncharacterized protein n=1 Tax=Seminavis robusta TaxID=568900 RepID=A0A9N8ECS4_9STRA|nr:unknown protein [Seminavis robusta]|eukprot:Sro959_g224770.1 n/a (599) ;mRNA; f:20499-22365
MGDKFPDYLLQECRNALSVHCRDIVMTDKGSGEVTSGQQELQQKVFHGSAGYASALDTFIEGKGYYASLFDRTPIENNREGNQERQSGYMLELKDIASCNEAVKYVVYERGFTREALAKNGEKELEGRNIGERAAVSLANYRLALKFHDEYCPQGKLPSGKSLEDAVLYVRQKMYVLLKGAKSKRSNSRRSNAKNTEKEYTEEEMPAKYMFSGYFTYLLWGPKGVSGETLSCLSVDGTDVPKVGRAASRQKELKIKAAERASDIGGTGPYHRGVAIKDKFACASLAVSELKEQRKNVRDLLFHNSTSESNCLQQLQQINAMLDRAYERDDDEREIGLLKKRKKDLFDSLDELAKRKKELEDESDRLMKQSSSNQVQVSAYYDAVGSFREVPGAVEVKKKHGVADSESSSLSASVVQKKRKSSSSVVVTTATKKQAPKQSGAVINLLTQFNSQATPDTNDKQQEEQESRAYNAEDDFNEYIKQNLIDNLAQKEQEGEDEEQEDEQNGLSRIPSQESYLEYDKTFVGAAAKLDDQGKQFLLEFRKKQAEISHRERMEGRGAATDTRNYAPGNTYYSNSHSHATDLFHDNAHEYYAGEEKN